MSKLEKLINELCPDGVEYKKIEEVCTISRGRVMSKDYIRNNKGQYPVYSSQTENNGQLGCINTYDFEGEYLTWTTDGANAGSVFYRNSKFSITNVCGLLKVSNNKVITKFLYYVLIIEAPKYVNKGMGNPKLMSNIMAKINIPMPPLEVQQEIVRILDTFTELTTELTTELDARKKQYEYYRDELLNFDNDIPRVSLRSIATISRGSGLSKKDFSEEGIGCIHYGQIYTRLNTFADRTLTCVSDKTANKLKKVNNGDIIMAVTSENVDDVCKCVAWLGKEEIVTGGHTAIIKHNQNPKYLAYYFQTSMFYKDKVKLAHGVKVIEVTPEKLNDIFIPLPSLQEQERIVSILDRFDSLCNDITQGIPAEIEARKKQYEYYRDKLLTFKKLKKEGV